MASCVLIPAADVGVVGLAGHGFDDRLSLTTTMRIFRIILALISLAATTANAAPPQKQTPAPVQ